MSTSIATSWSVNFLHSNTPTRATARVPTPPPNNPCPYYDNDGAQGAFIVRAGVEWRRGGDPCGRPGALLVLAGPAIRHCGGGMGTLAVALEGLVLYLVVMVAAREDVETLAVALGVLDTKKDLWLGVGHRSGLLLLPGRVTQCC